MPGRKFTGVALGNQMVRRLLGIRIKNSACKYGLHATFLQCVEFIGDINEARLHVESLFTGDMSWDNRVKKWQLDHVKPLGRCTSKEQFIERCHYSNVQPLLIIDNLRKGSSEQP